MKYFPFGIYDKVDDTQLDGFSQAQFEAYYSTMLDIMQSCNMNLVQLQPFNDTLLPVNGTAWYAARIEWFADQLAAAGMKFIYKVGNPSTASWDKVGAGETYHSVYTHAALYKLVFGDEPKTQADLTTFASGVGVINAAYAAIEVITGTIGDEMPSASVIRNIQSITESPAGTYKIVMDYASIGTDGIDGSVSVVVAGTASHDGTYTYSTEEGASDHPTIPPSITVTGAGGTGNQAAPGGTVTVTDGRNTDWYDAAWTTLGTVTRYVRFYPVRRTYGLTPSDYHKDKMAVSPQETWETIESMSALPYIAIIQAQGDGGADDGISKDYSNFRRLSTESEMMIQAHLALANGARGIMIFSLQTLEAGTGNIGMYDEDLSAAIITRDSSYPIDGAKRIGEIVNNQTNAEILLNHVAGSHTVASDNENIVAYPRSYGSTNYLYLINTNADSSETATVTATLTSCPSRLLDIFTGTYYPFSCSVGSLTVSITLPAGTGVMLKAENSASGYIK